jgi:outer membrane protein OmpA-like peptidoglycan-associated protein
MAEGFNHWSKYNTSSRSILMIRQLFLKSFLVCVIFPMYSLVAQNTSMPLMKDSSIRITSLRVNTAFSDFGPALIGDSLYFTSINTTIPNNIEKNLTHNRFDEVLNLAKQAKTWVVQNAARQLDKVIPKPEYYDLYKTGVDSTGNLTSNSVLIQEFMTHFNDGPVSYCAKTKELFITQNYLDLTNNDPFHKKLNHLKLIVAKQSNGHWEQIAEFPFNDPAYSLGHPAINERGDTLYFACDMPGGFGETDLYYSIRKDGIWNKPINLGAAFNTPQKDEFPFLTGSNYSNRYLIFASKGHQTKGGFDLFFVNLKDSALSVVPFPEPINTPSDDFAMTLSLTNTFGFFTSDRPGIGSDDIYKLNFEKFIPPQVKIYYQHILVVVDSKSRKPLAIASVNYSNGNKSFTASDGVVTAVLDNKLVNHLAVVAFGYKDKDQRLVIDDSKPGKVSRDTVYMDLQVNEKIVLRNIYYDYNKWDILPQSALELDPLVTLMKENLEIKVELSSHTDNRGSKHSNQILSQKRADAAVDYLVSKGIDRSRISGTGYGESQPVNKSSNNMELTPEQQRENRRTEIFIPGLLRGEAVKQKIGDFSDGKVLNK